MKFLKNTIKSSVMITLFLHLLCNDVSAAIHFHTVKTGGFISQMSAAVTESISIKPEKDVKADFFNTTELSCSKIGAVKTYSIKVIKKRTKFRDNSFNIKGTFDSSADNSASRFLIRPITGILTSSYGYRIHPKRKRKHFHSGIDLAAKSGTPIVCASSGKVVYAGWKSGYGYVVMVDHGKGYETLYAHCSRLSVTAGQKVNAGKVIAYVGRTGVATGPHLHFEVRKNGAFKNPLRYFKN